jgi:hypothetical protein
MRHPAHIPHPADLGARLGAAIACRAPAGGDDSESGQATTEYALVLLAAAFVGLLVVGWATTGAGAATVGRLFDRIMRAVIDQT